jgi:cell division protein FtsB
MKKLKTLLTLKKLNEVEFEKEFVIAKMSELHAEIDSLKSKNIMLIDKIDTLETEFELSKSQLQNYSSVKLDYILNSHKPFGDMRDQAGF